MLFAETCENRTAKRMMDVPPGQSPVGQGLFCWRRQGGRLALHRISWSLLCRERRSAETPQHIVKLFAFICMNVKPLRTPDLAHCIKKLPSAATVSLPFPRNTNCRARPARAPWGEGERSCGEDCTSGSFASVALIIPPSAFFFLGIN